MANKRKRDQTARPRNASEGRAKRPVKAAKTDAQSLPSRVSFMGLPVELRLQIYAYIPEEATLEDCSSGKQKYPGQQARGCAWGLTYRNTNIATLSILRVSNQLFAEAMPIIYQNIEFGPDLLKTPPSYAAEHIRKVFVICCQGYSLWVWGLGLCKTKYMDLTWTCFDEIEHTLRRSHFSNVMNLRACIDGLFPPKPEDEKTIDLDGITALATLQRVSVELTPNLPDAMLALRSRARQAIKAAMEAAGRQVVVHEVLRQ